jgi:ligand-binding sensor domain-containing protein
LLEDDERRLPAGTMMADLSRPCGRDSAAVLRCCARAASICLAVAGMLLGHREAAAQTFAFRAYQQAQGLGNLIVTCLTQDRDGFIWACTDNGLYRYDGVGFGRFGKEHGVDAGAIRTVIEDAAGSLIVATSQDLYRGDGANFKPIRPGGRALRPAAGSQVAVTSPEHVLVIDGGELLQLTAGAADGEWQSSAFFSASLLAAMPALAHLSSVHVDRLGRIWLGCGGAICRIEDGAVKIFDVKSGVPDDAWRSWALDRDGSMWVRSRAHLVVLEAQAARFEIRDPAHALLSAEILAVPLSVDRQGRILTSTDVGLSRWQGGWEDYSAMHGIPTTGIAAILTDRDGQVWLGVPGHGVERWLGYGHFASWTKTQGLGAPVWSIASGTDGGPLLATRTGCSLLDRAASIVSSCAFGDLPAGEIRVMAQAEGALWVGMTTGGLYRIAAADHAATWIADVPEMRKLHVDSTGQLWIGTGNGVAVIPAGSMQVQSLPLPSSPGEVADISEDDAGAIWLATQGGLLRWSGGRCTTMLVDGRQAAGGFTTVAAAAGGWVWAGAASHGMLHLRVSGERIEEAHWLTDLTLARAAMRFTRIDRRGWVWVGTDSGVALFDGRSWRRLDSNDGLTSDDTMPGGFLADTDGSVWIGTSAGITHIEAPETLLQTAQIDSRITRLALTANTLDAQPALQLRLRGWHDWLEFAAAIAGLLLVLVVVAWRLVKPREIRRERQRQGRRDESGATLNSCRS